MTGANGTGRGDDWPARIRWSRLAGSHDWPRKHAYSSLVQINVERACAAGPSGYGRAPAVRPSPNPAGVSESMRASECPI